MPTSYTNDVREGKTTDLEKFVLTCARAFGALIMMRDDPADAPIPEAFEPSTYQAEALAKAEKQKAELLAMSDAEIETECEREYQEKSARRTERLMRLDAERARYEDMLDKVRGWQPPSMDHVELKSFMENQLTESIEFDCGDRLRALYEASLEKLPATDWKDEKLAEADRLIAMSRQSLEEEIKRTNGRNLWIRQLRESLESVPLRTEDAAS